MNPDQPPTSARSREDAAVAPLFTHERSLSTKVGKGSDAHRIFTEQTQVLGAQLVTQLNILWKTARIHTQTNAALDPILNGLLATIRSLAAGGALTIRLQNDFLYLDDTHLKMRRPQAPIFIEFIEQVSSRRIGALVFAPDLRAQDLREFGYAFTRDEGRTSTLTALREEMAARGVQGIDLKEALRLSLRGHAAESSGQNVLKGLYAGAVGVVGDIMERIRHGRNPSFRQAKRIVQNLVDAILQDESSVLGLTTLRCYDEYTHNHSVNVCLLALALANRSGFPKPALLDLGVAALFHDIGKIEVPREVLNYPGELSPAEWELLQGHPVLGVLTLIRTR
ncbi:MAG: HD-GYP domain-containing protein, partial [Nitrospirales bacterium]